MSRYAILVEYDGAGYHGWQIQADVPTIQETLESALEELTGSKIRVTGAGRTDAGVHAKGQVAHFDLPGSEWDASALSRGLNSYLPQDLLIRECQQVTPRFHARFDARRREYRYRLSTTPVAIGRMYAWWVRYRLQGLTVLQDCATVVHGKHDFRSFMHAQSETENTVCTIVESTWNIAGEQLEYQITGDRFLHNMVRSLAGTMIEVARGRYTVDQFREFVEQPAADAPVVTAPAHGLFLIRIGYPIKIFHEAQDKFS